MCALGLGFLGRKGKRYGDLFSRTGKWKHSSFDIVQAAKERTKTRFSWPTPSRQKHWTKNNVRYITHCVVTFEASTKSNTLYKPGVKILLPLVEYISPGGLSTQGISTQKQHSFELHRNCRCTCRYFQGPNVKSHSLLIDANSIEFCTPTLIPIMG